MPSSAGIERGGDTLIGVGIAVFIIVIVLSLLYQGYSQTKTQLTNAGVSNAILVNYTTNAGGAANTFGNNVGLAIFVIVMAVVIFVIVAALRSRGDGGFLG